jgi:poly-gamma-glutamate synthesis protein (capsule biosynthesis protein)
MSVFILLGVDLFAQDTVSFADTSLEQALVVDSNVVDSNTLVIAFAGDIMGHDTQIEGAFVDSTNSYDYEPTFRYIKDYLSAADIAIANLEVTLAGTPHKGYPQFSSPDELALAARDAGFEVLVTANNHALDRGAHGVERTLTMLDSFNIIHAGTYRNMEEREKSYPLIIEKKGIRLALLNYTYGTNGLTVKEPYSVNRIDTLQIRKDIDKAKLANPDYIICVIHWGLEYERIENITQQKIARFILDRGVDAIIGSHPHVVQPIRLENCESTDSSNKCPVVYSMGNFVSNQRAQYKDGGIVAELHLSKNNEGVKFDSIAYLPYWVYREQVKPEKYTFYVVPVSKYEVDPDILNFNDNDLYKFNRFKEDTRALLTGTKESGFYLPIEN